MIGPLGSAKRRGTSSAPLCVACLYRIGWGIKRIVRHTGVAKTTVHRFARLHGLTDRDSAEGKKRAACKAGLNRGRRSLQPDVLMARALQAECNALRRQEANHWPKRIIVKRGVLTTGAQMDLYYWNLEAERERARVKAAARYQTERNAIARGDAPSNYWVARRVRSRINAVIKNALARKSIRSEDLCGCSWDSLVRHIEAQFCARMSWRNYGKAWHIDHIIPCASFDLRDQAQQRQCFHYTNLRPLWARANRKKSDKIINGQFSLLLPAA